MTKYEYANDIAELGRPVLELMHKREQEINVDEKEDDCIYQTLEKLRNYLNDCHWNVYVNGENS